MGFFDFITKPFKAIANFGKKAFSWIGDKVKSVFNTAKSAVQMVYSDVVSIAKKPMEIAQSAEHDVSGIANNTISTGGKVIGGLGNNIESIFKSPILLIGGAIGLMFFMKQK